MLTDPRAKAVITRFYSQWFHFGELAEAKRDAKAYPAWSATTTPRAMTEEAKRLLDDFIWRDGSRFLDVLTAQHTFVDANVAKIYGVTGPAVGWARLDYTPDMKRSGLLTLPGLLTLTAESEIIAPILRGKFVRESILCSKPPPPPDDIPALDESASTKTTRERLADHRNKPACAACHELLDPVGFGLENFDLIGKYRAADAGGRTLNGSGYVAGWAAPEFTGAQELARKLRGSHETGACAVKHLLRFSLGRSETPADACAVSDVVRAWVGSGESFHELLVAFAKSDAFRLMGEPR
jgi:hypothetical protein